ncbi:MAG: HEAT repeat domain-containing protein [Longimicrobiales bacterium]|nr:HEAT repeat domain-containing protein [Longimicrobiales bacterium]
MTTPQELLSALARAYSLTETRSGDDPEYLDALEEIRGIQEDLGWMVLTVQPEGLATRDGLVPDPYGEFGPFQAVLENAGIRELRFQEAMEPEALEEFLRRLSPLSALEGTLPSARFRGMEGDVGLSFRGPQAALPGMAGAVQDLFRQSAPDVQDTVAGGAGVASVTSASIETLSSSTRVLPPDLVEEVDAYLAGDDVDRRESGKRLRAAAARFMGSRNVAALTELIQLLAESAGSDPVDQEAIDLAAEFTTPAAASHLVARLGASREEDERSRLANVISRSGREGALALADALGESRDRSERRAFSDAMVRLGPLALEMAQRMMTDPRWFVVRNGVAVLGELGGEDAVAHLTATLANGDSRVRKETILSLAKVGGGDAEMLLLGMLDDGEGEVRAAACRALGVLRSHRAYRPLLQLLKDHDPEVQAECLHTLGQIGDPGAVPFIEKKAMGGLFSRPPREVRIAAFRALASIGTARALKILEKGVKDRDSDVQTVAKALTKEG